MINWLSWLEKTFAIRQNDTVIYPRHDCSSIFPNLLEVVSRGKTGFGIAEHWRHLRKLGKKDAAGNGLLHGRTASDFRSSCVFDRNFAREMSLFLGKRLGKRSGTSGKLGSLGKRTDNFGRTHF